MAIKVYINEPIGGLTDQSTRLWERAAISFTLIRGQRGTSSIPFIVRPGDSYQTARGSPLYIHEIVNGVDTIVYASKVFTVQRKWNGDYGLYNDTITAVSLESCFDTLRIDPPRSYSGMTAGQIVIALFNSLCVGVPVTLGTIDISAGGILPTQVYHQSERLSDVFTSLATLAGANIIWGVKHADSTLYFQNNAVTAAPFTLTNYRYETGDWTSDLTDYRNRQLIQIAFAAFSNSNQMFDGDDISQTLELPFAVDHLTTAMLTTGTQATATGIFGTLSPVASLNPSPGDSFTITPPHSPAVIEDPYTFVAALDNKLRNQILIGATAAATCQNTVDAINANPAKAGITFSLPTWENDACNADAMFTGPPPSFVLRVKNPGSGGNGCILKSTPFALSPFVPPAFMWEGGGSLSPFVPDQTLGGTDGATNALTVSVAGANTLATDVQYTPGSRLITCGAPIPAGSSLSVAYYRLGADTIAVEDTAAIALRATAEHGSGKYQQLLTDTQNTDAKSGYLKAVQYLLTYGVIPSTLKFDIDQAFGANEFPTTGQLLPIALIAPSGAAVLLDGSWVVQEIQAQIIAGLETQGEPYGHFRYTITVIDTNQVPTWVVFWNNLAIISPPGAQPVTNLTTITATPTLNPALPTNTTPPANAPPTTGTPTTAAGQQWVQEAPGRYAQWKASDLAVDAGDNTLVSSVSRASVAGDVGKKIIIITGAGWTPGEYLIASVPGGAYKLGSSPAAVSTTGGVWALVSDSLWCTRYNISPSFDGLSVAIISKNDKALNPFALGAVGATPGGGDYALQKGNQILFGTAPNPTTDRIMATYFPAGITPAPVGPSATKIAVTLDVQASDFPQPYTPHVPPGSDRHFFDVPVNGIQEAAATITAVGTTDLGVVWSLVSSDAHTTDSRIGTLSPSPNGGLKRLYTAPPVLPSTLTPPLPNVVVLGVQSHVDSTVKAFDAITLTGAPPPPPPHYVAIASGSSTSQQIMRSTNGSAWTAVSSPTDNNGGTCIANFGAGKFCALALDSSGSTWIAVTSTDGGATWTSHAIFQPANAYVDIVFGGGLLVGLGKDGEIITSSDGVTWSHSATISSSASQWNAIAYGAGVYTATGSGSSGAESQLAATSADTVTWTLRSTPVGSPLPSTQSWNAVTFAGGQYVAVGLSSGASGTSVSVMTSPDGVTAWSPQSVPPADSGRSQNGVAFGAALYVAVSADFSSGTKTLTSPDAITWTAHTISGSIFCQRVRFVNTLFFAFAGSGMLTSSDGLSWSTPSIPLDTGTPVDVAYG